MTKPEFAKAWEIARSPVDLDNLDDTVLDGCANREFKSVATTYHTVAKFLRYQCFYINGGFDPEELNNLRNIFKKKVTIVG